MIGSVTDVLSPILPFAGGVDLRRNENWGSWSSWLNLIYDGNNEARNSGNSFSFDPSSFKRNAEKNDSNEQRIRQGSLLSTRITLSTPHPFVSTDAIAEMTLGDVALTFRFALEYGREGFDWDTFVSGDQGEALSPELIKILETTQEAFSRSRGTAILPASTYFLNETDREDTPLSPVGYGDIDALQFCAAMRIFAEWRLLRQVPPGYKGYAVGMKMGHKDIVQNVAKIEIAVHQWIKTKADEVADKHSLQVTKGECLSKGETDDKNQCLNVTLDKDYIFPLSPTLRQLLSHEIETDLHPNLPRLKEKSASMGLLWVRRQLYYQTTIFSNVFKVPDEFPTMILAVGAAYSEVYDKFHSWAVQKIFKYTFQTAPDAGVIYRHMNPGKIEKLKKKIIQNELSCGEFVKYNNDLELNNQNIDIMGKQRNEDDDDIKSAPKQKLSTSKKDNNPWQKIGSHIASEWDKIIHHLGEEFNKLDQHNVTAEISKFGQNIGREFEKTWTHIEDETQKLTSLIFRNLNLDNKNKLQVKEFSGSDIEVSDGTLAPNRNETGQIAILTEECIDTYISGLMEMDARKHIVLHMKIVKPLLKDLAGLFAEMNCDDPTKV